MKSPRPSPAWRAAFLGLCCALAGALSYAEGWLPVLPVPGARLGLSNIVVMLVLYTQGLPAALAVAVVKAGFALLRGGTAGLFSLAGGLLSTVVMTPLLRGRRRLFGWVGVGIGGALAHNAGQLAVAALLTSPAVFYYAPWLALLSLATGALTGLTARAVAPGLLHHMPPPRGEL